MPGERLHTESGSGLLPLPQPNVTIKAATGKPPPIWTPGQREDRTGIRQVLEGCAQLRIPEPDGRLIPAAGKRSSIGSEGQAKQAIDWPNGPEQGPTLYVPELDAAIKAPARQRAFVRAERDRHHDVRMRLPGQVQGLACLTPHPYFAPLAARGPILPALADVHRPDSIEVLGVLRTASNSSRLTGSRRIANQNSTLCSSAERRANCSSSSSRTPPKTTSPCARNGTISPPKSSTEDSNISGGSDFGGQVTWPVI